MENSTDDKLFSRKRILSGAQRRLRRKSDDADFLFEEAAQSISERLSVINRSFDQCADLFSQSSHMVNLLQSLETVGSLTAIADIRAAYGFQPFDIIEGTREEPPLKVASQHLVTSVFGLHWSNALPHTFRHIHSALKDDGLLMVALPGAQTLTELRQCLTEAEAELTGNLTMRIDPFPQIQQCGELLQKTGFALPVVDSDCLTVRYRSFSALIGDLRGMGVTSKLSTNVYAPPKTLFARTEEIYKQRFADEDGKLRATFEIIYLSGWKPHASQQKPLKPGSAKNKMQDFM